MVRKAAFLLVLCLLIPALCACSRGIRGIDGIDWSEYDELVENIKAESDMKVREDMLHLAEDMLMDTGCLSPLFNYRDVYLRRDTLSGIYPTHYGAKYFMYAKTESGAVSAYLGETPDSFDPALAKATVALTIVENTFSGLFAHDAEGNVVPALVSEYTTSDDGLTYTFTLREGLLWSDGTSLGASDFIFSWRRAADNSTGSPYKYLFDIIAVDEESKKLAITADETDTVLTVKLKSPCSYFIELCAFPAFYPVNETCVESAEGYMDIYENIIDPDAWTLRSNYVTSGAFTFSGTAEGRYIYKKNPNYYDAENVTVDTFSVIYGADADAAYTMYESGDIDYLGIIPAAMHDELIRREDFHADDINGVFFLAYNFNSSAFSGMYAADAAALRRAISLFIDREYLIRSVTKNGEGTATAIVPDMIRGYNGLYRRNTASHTYPNTVTRGYFSASTEENRAEARDIIAALGMDEDGDGMLDPAYRFTLSYLTTNSAEDIAIAQSVQQDLAELGIMVKVTAADERVFSFESSIYNYDIIALGNMSYYDDAFSMLERWTTNAAGNYARLGSVIVEDNANAY